MKVNIYDLLSVYEEEIVKNVRNKKLICDFEKKKMSYLFYIKYLIESNTYDGGKYKIFLIFDPKLRVIMSQNMIDKIINHYISRYILEVKLEKYLCPENCATRKNMGCSYAVEKLKKDIEKYKKYDKFYYLKMDIKKYFYNIDHCVLKKLLKPILKVEEFELISKIIDSTNKPYINEKINYYNEKLNYDLPLYHNGKGLPIGNLSSQILAIFYLYKVHHYIKHDLRIKYFNIYMDDYIILHENKKYLIEVKNKIEFIINTEYRLLFSVNKTYIKASNEKIDFLGYTFKVANKKTIIKITKKAKMNLKNKMKKRQYEFANGEINFETYFSSYQTYKNSYKYDNSKKIDNRLAKIVKKV